MRKTISRRQLDGVCLRRGEGSIDNITGRPSPRASLPAAKHASPVIFCWVVLRRNCHPTAFAWSKGKVAVPFHRGGRREKGMSERFVADPVAENLGSSDRGQDEASAQEPPEDGTDERLPLAAHCRRELLASIYATFKAAEIGVAGLRVHNAAAFALALTAIEDAFALYRARRSCRSTIALLAVERDHAVYMARETVRRIGLMARIGREVGEETAYPLRMRFEVVLENLRRVVFF